MADHLYIRYEREGPAHPHPMPYDNRWVELLWCEWKRRGGKAKSHQIDWHARERARGALVIVAGEDFPASIEGFLGWYNQSGLARHKLAIGPLSKIPIRAPKDPLERLGEIAQECMAKVPR
jgi:hypothetical protein